ncbi:MAG TPA: sugar transferase [Bacteroidales bacterium]|nr:sugar transferase [Bacteroidales bacterium]HRZ76789.1 sugar transferase [Bacteroidales bacterium]
MKRLTDILGSLFGLLLLSPLLLLLALAVVLDSKGGVLYRQERVGRRGKVFRLLKFRTMRPLAERGGLLSLGGGDPRITRVGAVLRKYKLDELPQLFNVLLGQMSLVGPRPEVPRYVAHYDERQRKVLSVRPGLTDYASLEYFDEGELLAASPDPEKTYLESILPRKLELALRYVAEQSLRTDLRILCRTLLRILR